VKRKQQKSEAKATKELRVQKLALEMERKQKTSETKATKGSLLSLALLSFRCLCFCFSALASALLSLLVSPSLLSVILFCSASITRHMVLQFASRQALCAPGQYSFRFKAQDSAGNTATRTLAVHVVERAVTAFSITLQTAHLTLVAAQAEGAALAEPTSLASLAVYSY
jgi:hypothetical protein